MVQGPRIELGSTVLQTVAEITRLAHLACCLGCLTGIDPVLIVPQTIVQATTLQTPRMVVRAALEAAQSSV